MAKPVVKFKTYRQDARVGGKIYGVADLSDPQIASVTMQEVIDYAKLHNYSAVQLESLMSQVISGVADLVARDGRPRNLSDLLKFEPVIKGTFDTLTQGITDQKILIRPRLLKDIRVNVEADTFSWQNQNDNSGPRLLSVAPANTSYTEFTVAMMAASLSDDGGFGFTLAGSSLAPNGWDANCAFELMVKRTDTTRLLVPGVDEYYLNHITNAKSGGDTVPAGYYAHDSGDATDNVVDIQNKEGYELQNWWYYVGTVPTASAVPYEPVAGDILTFRMKRLLGTGEWAVSEKQYTLV